MSAYTPTQIQQFYSRISLPEKHRHEPGEPSIKIASSVETGLPFLAALQKYSLTSIPFENLSLHYSTHHSISVSPSDVFEKIVAAKEGKSGRGGYCMENNTLLLHVLLGLGFAVYSTGARISSSVSGAPVPLSQVTFSGWSHMVNLISFPDSPTPYLVDVGFGGGGATKPLPLLHSESGILNIAPSTWGRLVHTSLPNSRTSQEFWVYEKRGKEGPWSPCYCFFEMEFTESDFGVMNLWTSTCERSWFTKIPVCLRMVFGDEEEIVGSVQVFKGEFKERNGDEEMKTELRSERDRVEVLREVFGIRIGAEERRGIKGMVSEIV